MMIYFGNEIAGGDVKRHTAGERKRVSDCKSEILTDEIKDQNADKSRQPD